MPRTGFESSNPTHDRRAPFEVGARGPPALTHNQCPHKLTHAASSIQSRHYGPFAAFITAVFLYWGLCLIIEAGVSSIGRVAEARR